MKIRYGLVAGAAAGLAAMVASSAVAQNASACSCLVPAAETGSIIGQLTRVQGNVQMSQAAGYADVRAGAVIPAGARIMTGSQSSASLSVGADCALDMPANATVRIDPTQGGMCVSLEAPQAALTPASTGPDLTPVLLGGGAVGGAAALILGLQDDDNSVSR